MPEASAASPSPVKSENPGSPKETWVTYNDQGQVDFQESVKKHLKQAGIEHNPVPVRDIPPYVPSGESVNTSHPERIQAVQGSYGETKTPFSGLSAFSEHLDYADQLVTGRTHVVGEAGKFKAEKGGKETKRMKEANRPKNGPKGPFGKFIAWLHDEAA